MRRGNGWNQNASELAVASVVVKVEIKAMEHVDNAPTTQEIVARKGRIAAHVLAGQATWAATPSRTHLKYGGHRIEAGDQSLGRSGR